MRAADGLEKVGHAALKSSNPSAGAARPGGPDRPAISQVGTWPRSSVKWNWRGDRQRATEPASRLPRRFPRLDRDHLLDDDPDRFLRPVTRNSVSNWCPSCLVHLGPRDRKATPNGPQRCWRSFWRNQLRLSGRARVHAGRRDAKDFPVASINIRRKPGSRSKKRSTTWRDFRNADGTKTLIGETDLRRDRPGRF